MYRKMKDMNEPQNKQNVQQTNYYKRNAKQTTGLDWACAMDETNEELSGRTEQRIGVEKGHKRDDINQDIGQTSQYRFQFILINFLQNIVPITSKSYEYDQQ